jgi:hypothetical protein
LDYLTTDHQVSSELPMIDKPSGSFREVFGGVLGVGESTIFLSWSRRMKFLL